MNFFFQNFLRSQHLLILTRDAFVKYFLLFTSLGLCSYSFDNCTVVKIMKTRKECQKYALDQRQIWRLI